MIDRRTFVAAAGALAASPAFAQGNEQPFPKDFLWGAATAGHQVEGDNTASDIWLLENIKPTTFSEPSGSAVNNFGLWRDDLDLVKSLGLNSYRFSIEWARIEPERGLWSLSMLDHYKALIDGCRERDLTPLVTYNHFTAPRWFSAAGGWLGADAPKLFANYCERATRHLGANIGYAVTMNEPDLLRMLRAIDAIPEQAAVVQRAMLAAAARAMGTAKFAATNVANNDDLDAMLPNLIAGHKAGRAAIKSVRGDLPVGVSLAMLDDQAVGSGSLRDAKRREMYGAWLEAAKGDDFLGVQNYQRMRWDAKGKVAPPAGSLRNWSGDEVWAPSLAGAVRYAHQVTRLPIIVTEHGVGTDDDTIRANLIPAALAELKKAMDEGVPVKGYVHWSLLDNYEWVFAYKPRFGLVSVDRTTFKRTPKPSASVYGAIARKNML